IGAGVALFLAIVFMIAMDMKGLSVGYGVFLFFIGGIGCLIGGILAMGKAAPAGMGMGMPMPMQSGGMPPMQQPSQGAPMAMPYGMPPMPGGGYGAFNAPPVMPRTSGMAIAGFILSFFCSLLGLIFSIIGYNEARKSGGAVTGEGLALAGIIISIIGMLLGLV